MKTEMELLAEAKLKMGEDAKTIMAVVGSLLYGKDMTSSQITRGWNVVQATSSTFRNMLNADNISEFLAERERLYAAYGGLVDILKLKKKDS